MSERARIGDWQQSFSGQQVWPLDPLVEDFNIRDVAHHLSLETRFLGATFVPYNVAEHSVRVSHVVEHLFALRHPHVPQRFRVRAALAALMHDAPESVVRDIPRPLKKSPRLAGYGAIEERVARVMEAWCSLPLGAFEWPIVSEADGILLVTEKRDHLAPAPAPWGSAQGRRAEPLPRNIGLWHLHGAAAWARSVGRVLTEAALDLDAKGFAGAIRDATREVLDSGPWPWWLAERRFLARWEALTADRAAFAPERLHYHHCPRCYESAPCTMDCTFERDLEESGIPFGHHAPCADCAPLVAAEEAGEVTT